MYTLYQYICVHGPRAKYFFSNFDLNLWLAILCNGSLGPPIFSLKNFRFQYLCQVLYIALLEKHFYCKKVEREGRARQTQLLAFPLIENDN